NIVVVAGSSYAGSLAAWARIKYPHKIDIAYSSSGPLYSKADFPEYFANVEENLRLASPTCPQLIRRAMVEAMEMLETQEGAAILSELFNTCEPLQGPVEPDRSYFLTSLSSPFADVAQTADPGDLVNVCERLESNTGSDLEKLAQYIVPLQYCIWTYDLFIDYYSGTNVIGSTMRTRQWLYQTCTEFGWYQTQAFGDTFTVDLFYQLCSDVLGEQFTSSTVQTGVKRTNLFYGNIKPKVTRLITYHGTADPWSTVGLQNDLNDSVITIIVNGTSHSADLYTTRDSDPEELKQARTRIMNTISTWISEIEEIKLNAKHFK
ncbi:putative serine protease K12H4.7, partial [Agrilus planipennis]|uniref:Serine protease K12H4.7 n=1 Tax=Agrilus planipennis TaxID=224129 RepID=A0A7F5R2G6_AGRPL